MNQPEKQVKWRSLIAEQKESGQSAAAFCRTRGLREALFYYWKKQLQEVAKSQFVEVQVAKADLSQGPSRAALGSTIEVRLGNGRSLMVAPEFNAGHLRALLAVLEYESGSAYPVCTHWTGRRRRAFG